MRRTVVERQPGILAALATAREESRASQPRGLIDRTVDAREVFGGFRAARWPAAPYLPVGAASGSVHEPA